MQRRDANRLMWDERVPIHERSAFYDVPGFRAGRTSLRAFEWEELGSPAGLDLVHLQCHIGLDTLSWARLGARVTGLDFSAPAVEAAERLARELGIQARFVCADVYEAPDALGASYDIVYTGVGALLWLDDIAEWAAIVARLLRPGGVLYLVEVHPFIDVFADETLHVVRNYFHDPEGMEDHHPGTYADETAPTVHNRSFEWRHPLGDVVSALCRHGLHIELLREHDFTVYGRWPFLERRADRTYRMPEGMPRLPLLYSLKARKPA